MTRSSVNEERLFQKIGKFFGSTGTILVELAQNAQRSGASTLSIALEGSTLTVKDDGHGAEHVEPLFILADSGWTEETNINQDSAGWGLMFLLTVAQRIFVRSVFGSISVDCKEFLNSAHYRSTMFDTVNRCDAGEGFYIGAELTMKAANEILRDPASLRYFPLDIVINGNALDKGNVRKEALKSSNCVISTVYEGNEVYIRPDEFRRKSAASLLADMKVIWYGILICRHSYYVPEVWINVTNGCPLTPVLPIRSSCQEDEKGSAFYDFVRDQVARYCIAFINDPANKDEDALRFMHTMAAIGTQRELDGLQRFFVSVAEPYHDLTVAGEGREEKVVHKGDRVPVNEYVEQVVLKRPDGKGRTLRRLISEEMEGWLFLPQGAIHSVYLGSNCPSWLVVRDMGFALTVVADEAPAQENYSWLKARKIHCGGKKISALAMIDGWCDGTFVYIDTPGAAYDVTDTVFQSVLYSEDSGSDTYETQKDYFEKDIEQDIMRVTGAYERRDLLKGLALADIRISTVQKIVILGKAMIISLSDGQKRTLKLTA